ncbi:MAG: hypothetical protein AAF250_15265 [Pseudomonadota bacterium]
MDTPPVEAPAELNVVSAEATGGVEPHLPMEERDDGSVLIDLMPLTTPPSVADCLLPEPDPFNPEIVVCGNATPPPRLGPQVGPTEEEEFGSAIPRAKVRLSEDATAELNGTQTGVGGFTSQGGEVRVKIDF